MFTRNKEPQYNQQKLNRAITSGGLRIVVAGYIIFIAINIINGTKNETSSIPAWAGALIGYVFIAASAGFIIYAVRSFLKALKGARLDADGEEKTAQAEREPEKTSEMSIAQKVRSVQAMLPPENKNGTDKSNQ